MRGSGSTPARVFSRRHLWATFLLRPTTVGSPSSSGAGRGAWGAVCECGTPGVVVVSERQPEVECLELHLVVQHERHRPRACPGAVTRLEPPPVTSLSSLRTYLPSGLDSARFPCEFLLYGPGFPESPSFPWRGRSSLCWSVGVGKGSMWPRTRETPESCSVPASARDTGPILSVYRYM